MQHRSTRVPIPAALLIAAIRLYRQFLSPLLPPSCRFSPTCSEYAAESIRTHGAARGSWLASLRLLRCHPGHAGGWDPVPPRARKDTGIFDGPQDAAGLCALDPGSDPLPGLRPQSPAATGRTTRRPERRCGFAGGCEAA